MMTVPGRPDAGKGSSCCSLMPPCTAAIADRIGCAEHLRKRRQFHRDCPRLPRTPDRYWCEPPPHAPQDFRAIRPLGQEVWNHTGSRHASPRCHRDRAARSDRLATARADSPWLLSRILASPLRAERAEHTPQVPKPVPTSMRSCSPLSMALRKRANLERQPVPRSRAVPGHPSPLRGFGPGTPRAPLRAATVRARSNRGPGRWTHRS